jgi:hypothetical protein
MIVKCQQKDIFKIRDKIPGHGPQEVSHRFLGVYGEYVYLECGCYHHISHLTNLEREGVLREVPKPIQRTRSGPSMNDEESHAFMLSLGLVLFHECHGMRYYRSKEV